MNCPKCKVEMAELERSVNLGGYGSLILWIFACRRCNWREVSIKEKFVPATYDELTDYGKSLLKDLLKDA